MKKGIAALLGALVMVLPGGSTLAGSTREAESELNPIGASGIQAEIEFVDTGRELMAKGEAEGLTPGQRYISLIYDIQSSAFGPRACQATIPPGRPGFLDFAKMSLGEWRPVDQSERKLVVGNFNPRTGAFTPGPKTGAAYTPIGTFVSVSVRQVMRFRLVACGAVVSDD